MNTDAPASGTAAKPVYSKKKVFAWALYDFSNNPFNTLVVTFVYSTFFTVAIASDSVTGTTQWSQAMAVSAVLVALLSPLLGALADRANARRGLLAAFTFLCVGTTALLYFPIEGQVALALGLFIVANFAFEVSYVFYNSYLPALGPRNRIGRISGFGWAMGYVGGLLALVVALVVFIQPETPPFGLDAETGGHVRATNLLVAGWYALFALPLLLTVPNPPRRHRPTEAGLVRSTFRELGRTFAEIRRFRQVFRLLLARLLYNDGLITLFAFGGIYAAGTFGMDTGQILVFGIVLNVAACLGAFSFGYIDDRLGGKKTLFITLAGLIAASCAAVLSPNVVVFWIAAIIVGLLAGPNQATSRSLLGRFTPSSKEGEFYGFFAFSGKITAFLGPFALGWVTALTGSQRAGMAVVVVFFILGAIVLWTVDEEEGRAIADRTDSSNAS
ncbi:MAG: MFS transporter [Puniceicoccaceae bacterium]|nr:MAG: MFS transporter [Puniceicoccaceae bacterium]